MSDLPGDEILPAAAPLPRRRSFVFHAKLIGGITLLSRLLGLARESIAARYFGAGAVWSAFTFAFTIPNLFRKLLGEGALSAAFIPLYAASVKRDDPIAARRFASASVNLLGLILVGLTIVGELVLLALALLVSRPDYVLALELAAIMLPYVLLVCGAAFLGAILQVHDRFAETAATSIVLNLVLIVTIALAAGRFDLSNDDGRRDAVRWLAVGVVVSGVLQLLILLPALRAVGFRFDPRAPLRTPAVKKMLRMSVPVAIGAGVLQLGVLVDKSIAFFFAEAGGVTHFTLLGTSIAYPLAEGAAARLNWAQFMYQFPLGVFAIALATAIFPRLSSDAAGESPLSRGSRGAAATPEFRAILRRGVEASLFIGLPASAGMIVVRDPAVRLLFEGGSFTRADSEWVALSTAIYSAAIWAFSLQQILNRAYYALHDTLTPLVWTILNLLLNLLIEIPLLWTPLRESGIAVGTLVSFAIQAVVMLWMLDRRAGGLGLAAIAPNVAKMTIATAVMWVACYATLHAPVWTMPEGKTLWASQLAALMLVGGLVYFATCAALGVGEWRRYLPGSRRGGRSGGADPTRGA